MPTKELIIALKTLCYNLEIFLNALAGNFSIMKTTFRFTRLLLFLPFASAFFFIFSCKQAGDLPIQTGFYYWKTTLNMDSLEWNYLDSFGASPMYVHMFDVDYSAGYGKGIPLADLRISGDYYGHPIIPVVFITNRVLSQTPESDLPKLAQGVAIRILDKLDWFAQSYAYDYYSTHGYKSDIQDSIKQDWLDKKTPEFQLDCDWTAKTRDKYFRFLQFFKENIAGRKLSCTVRLHQYRDQKAMGIPPVDRAMLMCYNMGDPKNAETPNAILDLGLVQSYLKKKNYPLPLDVALPVFSWAAWFRGGEFRGLMRQWDEKTLGDTSLFQPTENQQFRIRKDTVWGNDYIREGDVFRLDKPAENDLMQSVEILRNLTTSGSRVVFFDWEKNKIKQHETLLKNCFARF